MKKTMLLLAAAALAAVSCSKADPEEKKPAEPEVLKLNAPVLTISPAGEISAEEDSETVAATLSWTSAVPEGKEADVTYTLYVNNAASDMYTNPTKFEAGHALTLGLKAAELAEIASKIEGDAAELQFAVYAKASDDEVEPVVSNTVKAKVSVTGKDPEVPQTLWFLGSATVAGWDKTKAISVTAKDKVYTLEGVELNLTVSDTGFKYLFANDESSTCFLGPDLSSETFGAVKLYTEDDGTANLFQPALNGYKSGVYTIVLNLNTWMMTMTRTGDIEYKVNYGDNVYPLGDCFEWKWAFTNPMGKTADKVYEMKNVHLDFGDGNNGFKIFIEKDKWSPYFAQTDASQKDAVGIQLVTDTDQPQFKPGLLGYESGKYDIKADFNTMTLTLTLVSKDETPAFDESKAFYLYGGGFENGVSDWAFDTKNALVENPDGSGIYVSPGTIYLNRWCYFKLEKKDWTEYRRNANATDYWTAISKADAAADDTFSPGNGFSEWTDGNYKVTFNINTLKLSLEKAE